MSGTEAFNTIYPPAVEDDLLTLALVSVAGLVIGAFMMPFARARTAGRLVLFFGMQSGFNTYMHWVLHRHVTVPKGTFIRRTGSRTSADLTGCPAQMGLTACQQAVSFMAYVVYLLCCNGNPKQLRTQKEAMFIAIFGWVFALKVALNSLNGFASMSMCLLVRILLPFSTEACQRFFSLKNLYSLKRTSGAQELLFLALGVICASIFTTGKLAAEGGSYTILGVISSLASLFCESLNLVMAGTLCEMRFNVWDSVAYMAVPAMLFLAPIVILVPQPVPSQWRPVFGDGTMTDYDLLMGTWSLSSTTACLLAFSGLLAFFFNILQFSIVQDLTPTHAAFAQLANQAGLLVVTLLPPFPGHVPNVHWIWVSSLINVVAFGAYTFLQLLPEPIEEPPSGKSLPAEKGTLRTVGGEAEAPLLDPESLETATGDSETTTAACSTTNSISEVVPVEDNEKLDWVRLGGAELEQPIREGWVALLRVGYICQLASEGGVLSRRQEVPASAYASLEELQRAKTGCVSLQGEGLVLRKEDQEDAVRAARLKAMMGSEAVYEWLPIIVLSYPWLQPSHPDMFGETLQLVARACRLFPPDHAILIDYTALPQPPRSHAEEQTFRRALRCIHQFYSHPSTIVFRVISLPPKYPNGKNYYELPANANVGLYPERGWCFAESAMISLLKDGLIWDLCNLPEEVEKFSTAFAVCKNARMPPMAPEDFDRQLIGKTFTRQKDGQVVQQLFREAFVHRIGNATTLDFSGLSWGALQAEQLLYALRNSSVRKLSLRLNNLGDDGACVVAEELTANAVLQQLDLRLNRVGVTGAGALGSALKSNDTLQQLDLCDNNLGDEGVQALVAALGNGRGSVQQLGLHSNGVGADGAVKLAEALNGGAVLQHLDLSWNLVQDRGAKALGDSLKSTSTLRQLDLHGNGITDEGAAALADALVTNSTLQLLDLSWNRAGKEGARALAQALMKNGSLTQLKLAANQVGFEGAQALAEALAENSVLQQLDLSLNRVKADGARALANARSGGSCHIVW